MPYGNLDDGFWDHPKIVDAGNEIAGAVARLISYCSKHGTDGIVPLKILRGIADRPKVLRELILREFVDVFEAKTDPNLDQIPTQISPETGAKNWRKSGLVFRLHDYLDHNMSAEQWQSYRKGRSDAGKKGAAARWGKSDGSSHGKPMGDPSPSPDPDPIEIDSSSISKLWEVEKEGFSKYGGLNGVNAARIKNLLPIGREEFAHACNTKGTSWAYFAKVLVSVREAAAEPAPRRGPKRLTQRQKDDIEIARRLGLPKPDFAQTDPVDAAEPLQEVNGT